MKRLALALLLVFPLASLLLLFAVDSPPAPAPANLALRQAALQDLPRFVFLAVLEGLYTDGVSNDHVDGILARDPESLHLLHFVQACPICMPAHDALQTYRRRAPFSGRKDAADTFGPGLPAELAARLESKELEVRLAAINGLVESWVRRRLEARRLKPEEQEAWTWAIGQGRDKGMQMLLAGLRKDKSEPVPATTTKRCAFCEGAAGACKLK